MFAGHDTTSSALSRILHCLVSYPGVQEKLREEIQSSGILNGEFTYEELIGLPYLDAIVRETLRL
jgi:cytochrome P450